MMGNRQGQTLRRFSGCLTRTRRGQSTVEYIVLVSAVILVIILFANNNNRGLRKKMNDVFTNSTQDIEDRSAKLKDTHEGVSKAVADAAAAKNKPTLGVDPTVNEFKF